MKNIKDEQPAQPTKIKTSPKSNISSLCREAQGFLSFLNADIEPPGKQDQIEREKMFAKVKIQLGDF